MKVVRNSVFDCRLSPVERQMAIQSGDKLGSKTLFLAIFDSHSSIFKSVFDCRLSGVISDLLQKV